MPAAPAKAVELFYSYVHKDEDLRNQLAEHLSSLRRQGYITEWYDRQIGAGTEWVQEINAHLNTATIILLLISSSFLASDYCYGIEMHRALERHDTKEALVIPIILRPVDWQGTPFEKLHALPANGKPITTWPNQDEALLDVTRGIRKAIEVWTTPSVNFPPTSSEGKYWNVPHQRNPYFTGQEALLTDLHHQFEVDLSAASTRIQAISGLGGIGKTQIALEYAYRHRDAYRAVLWVNADTRESLVVDYVALAALLGLPEQDARDHRLAVEAIKRWLETHDQWLLILDNADDVALVREFLPGAGQGHILLTTRAAAQGSIAQGIEVQPMEEVEGALFVLRRTKRLAPDGPLDRAVPADRVAATVLVQTLGGLPLALDQAGAYIEETGCDLSGYVQRYHTQHATLLQRRGRLVTGHPAPVATTWSLSFEKIEQANAAAADLLRFCAFVHPDAIPEEFITVGTADLGSALSGLAGDLIALDEAMEALRAYSLVRRNAETQTLSIHYLVQTVLRDAMPDDLQRRWAEQVVRSVQHVFPDPQEVDNWFQCQRAILHAQVCATLIDRWDLSFPEAALLLNKAGYYLDRHALYSEAEPLYRCALAIYERVLGPDHPDTASSLNNLAALYDAQGKYVEAEPLLQRALAIYEQVQGPNHPDTALSLNNLAALYKTQGKYVEAESLLQRALAIYEQVLSPNHPNMAHSLNNLAALYDAQGQYAEAEPLYRRALVIYEQVQGPNHPDTALSLNNLAALYGNQGQYAEAKLFLQRALAIYERVLGPDHPDTASSLNKLAALYRAQGKYAEAEPLLQRALAIYKQALGPNHPDTALSLNNLATLYRVQGKYAEAESLYRRALAICEQMLSPDHPNMAHGLNNLAALYDTQGKYAEAEPLYRRALAIYELVLGPNHPNTVTIRANYTALLWKQQH